VLAVSDTSVAIYLPGPRPRVVIYDETGNEVSSTDLPAPPDWRPCRTRPSPAAA
jgi:hypothetical protein